MKKKSIIFLPKLKNCLMPCDRALGFKENIFSEKKLGFVHVL